MFEPTSYWDMRASLTEGLVMKLLDILAQENPQLREAFVGHWMAQNSGLKNFYAEKVLGPVPTHIADHAATGDFLTLMFQLNTGAAYTQGAKLFEAIDPKIGVDASKHAAWLATLPDFQNDVTGSIAPSFFREQDQQGNVGPIFAFIYNDQFYAISSAGYSYVMVLSLKHQPESFTWKRGQFRTELYDYRNDVTKIGFCVALGKALADHGVKTLYVPSVGGNREMVLDELEFADLVTTLAGIINVEGAKPIPVMGEFAKPANDDAPSGEIDADGLEAEGASDDIPGSELDSSSTDAPTNTEVANDSTSAKDEPA